MSSESSLIYSQAYAYHTGSPEASHIPVHGGIAVYARIPNFPSNFIGTLSGIVFDSKKKYLLSNQHVFFPYQSKSPAVTSKGGLSVYMTGDPKKSIGKTLRTKAESNPWPKEKKQEALDKIGTFHDSAIATTTVPVSDVVNNIGKQRGSIAPKAGMRIKFFGRTSRLQRGVITKPDVNNINDVGGDRVQVQKHIIFSDISSASGDSGSLVFNEDNRVVGVLFGKINSTGATVICRASAIENAYNVVFSADEVSGGGTTPTPKPEPEPKPVPAEIPIQIPDIKWPELKDIKIDLKDKATQGLLIIGGALLVVITIGALAPKSK